MGGGGGGAACEGSVMAYGRGTVRGGYSPPACGLRWGFSATRHTEWPMSLLLSVQLFLHSCNGLCAFPLS